MTFCDILYCISKLTQDCLEAKDSCPQDGYGDRILISQDKEPISYIHQTAACSPFNWGSSCRSWWESPN